METSRGFTTIVIQLNHISFVCLNMEINARLIYYDDSYIEEILGRSSSDSYDTEYDIYEWSIEHKSDWRGIPVERVHRQACNTYRYSMQKSAFNN